MSRDEAAVEQQIQDKGLTAPRLTPELIDATIVVEDYHVFDGSCLTVCVLTLHNGFTVTGESACASPENFDAEIGREIALTNARDKIWALEGYLLRQRLHDGVETDLYIGSEKLIPKKTPKTLHNSTVSGARQNVKDIEVVGNGDMFRLLCKASSEAEGWMKSTKAMEIHKIGCVVQVTTQQRNPDGSYSVAEAATFVPHVKIVNDENGGRRLASI